MQLNFNYLILINYFSKEVLTRSKNHLNRKKWELPKNFKKFT